MDSELKCLQKRICKTCNEEKNLLIYFNYGKKTECKDCRNAKNKKAGNAERNGRWNRFLLPPVKSYSKWTG